MAATLVGACAGPEVPAPVETPEQRGARIQRIEEFMPYEQALFVAEDAPGEDKRRAVVDTLVHHGLTEDDALATWHEVNSPAE